MNAGFTCHNLTITNTANFCMLQMTKDGLTITVTNLGDFLYIFAVGHDVGELPDQNEGT